jgi:hypothetical protein
MQDPDVMIMEQSRQTGCHVKATRESTEKRESLEFFVESEVPVAQLRVSAWQYGVLVEATVQEAIEDRAGARHSGRRIASSSAGRSRQSKVKRSTRKGGAPNACNDVWTFTSCRPLLSAEARLISFPGGIKVVVPVDTEAEACLQVEWKAAFASMAR